ncbi:MAG: FAD-dependent oxidoreductase [Candidatus Pacearchaeota archaeon]
MESLKNTRFSRFESEILEILKLTENVKHFKISVPKNFNFIPGQYISIIMDDKEKNIKLRRPYSIISTIKNAKKGYIGLCIKILENGNITPLLDKLKKSDKIECLGPLGNFKINEESKNKDIIFISTGVGIAPFMSMVPHLLEEVKSDKKIRLLTGYKLKNDILYGEELKNLEKKHKNFKYYTILSEESNGKNGRVQDLLKQHFDKNADYYICGLKEMISAINIILLKKGILGKNIYTEKYD